MSVELFFSRGDRVGPYEILSPLGARMVYLALDTRLDRFVILKVLPAWQTRAADSTRRFVQQAKAASALNHPNIITIYEIVEAEAATNSGHIFAQVALIVMEPFPSVPLRERVRQPIPLDALVHVGLQMADALAVAHAAGIVHRRLNLENIMVQVDNYVKILGFGLAELERPISRDAFAAEIVDEIVESDSNHHVWNWLNTASMSPEQVGGNLAAPAMDVFSLGVVLYALAAGQHPFQGS